MRLSAQGEITKLLVAWHDGDADALSRVVPLVYTELSRLARRYMRSQPGEQVLQTTALVNEALLKMAGASHVSWSDRAHFLAVCAQVMRRIVVDSARARSAQKRGTNPWRLESDEYLYPGALSNRQVVQLDDALTAFARLDLRKSKAIELQFFGGLGVEETAEALGIPAKQFCGTGDSPAPGDKQPAVSPDGRSLLFTRDASNSLHAYHVYLSREFRPEADPKMLINESANSSEAVWTPDGSGIVLARGAGFETSLWRLRHPRSGSQPEKPERMAFAKQGVIHPAFSRQGRLAYGELSGDVDIWRLEVRGARPAEKPAVRLIASTHLDHDVKYSPDGTRIAFASTRSGSHEIWICDSNGANASQLTNIGSPYYTAGPRWSPDGQTLGFNSDVVEKRSAYLVNASGGKTKRLGVRAIEGWSRDGKYIYVKSAADTKGLFKTPVAGGNPVKVPAKCFDSGAIESPDGKYLYYEGYDGNAFTIRRQRLQDGDDVQLISSVNADNFAVASTGIYFIPDGPHPAIQFLSFADGKTSTIAKLPRMALYGFSLSPDERYLLYTQYEDRGSNLMLVENFH